MSYHAFSLDPRTVLGVGPGASAEQIREAYRAKSKKHHPDVGGDEWAFRLVATAYEVLKGTASAHSAQGWQPQGPGSAAPTEGHRWNWAPGDSFSRADSSTSGWGSCRETAEERTAPSSDGNAGGEADSASQEGAEFRATPDELRNVNVEVVWARFERDAADEFSSSHEADDPTLSVCMIISWPPNPLVDRAAEFPSSGETLRTLIDLFGHLRTSGSVIAARSRIEDGQFVAWLSYPDVVTAGSAFLLVRETFQNRGLIPKLKTRDVRLPSGHDDAPQEPVTADAS